jgi:hypothetical protein
MLWQDITRNAGTSALQGALIRLDIHPFTSESVSLYKKQTIDRLNRKHRRLFWWAFWTVQVLWCIGALLVVLLSPKMVDSPLLSRTIGFLFLSGLGTLVSTMVGGSMESTSLAPIYTWRDTPIRDYGGRVPEFALVTALRVQKECPLACFSIQHLVDIKTSFAGPDPFLVVRVPDGQEYYLEVWDEPGFKAVRQV